MERPRNSGKKDYRYSADLRMNLSRRTGTESWKTQHIEVSRNQFDFDPASLGPKCTLANQCGFQGVFSEYGTFPSWSPYKGNTVWNHITYGQGNHFSQNSYTGPWRFMAQSQGNVVTWAGWQAKPFGQDAGSTLDPKS